MLKSRFALLVLLCFATSALLAAPAAAKPVLQWSPPELVAANPPASPTLAGAEDISCAGPSLCVAVGRDGKLLYSADPTGGIDAWSEAQVGDPEPADLTAVSCPEESFCAAVDAAGNVFLSTDPKAGAWTKTAIGDGDPLTAVACPSAGFCAAGDDSGEVLVSEDPGGGAGAWDSTELDEGDAIRSISCASPSLCVAVAEEDVFSSTDPGGGAWSSTGIDNYLDVSCPSASFCAATGFFGVFVSDEPEGGAGAWTASTGAPESGGEIACPTEGSCVVVDYLSRIFTSDDPGGADPGWEEAALRDREGATTSLSCPADDFCAAVQDTGGVFTAADPAGGPHAWRFTATEAGAPLLSSVECPAANLCLAAGSHGTLYTTTEPTVPGSWNADRITDGRLEQVECKTPEWCFARAYNRTLLYSSDPTGGPEAWDSASMPFAVDAACPEFFFCAAVDGSDNVLLSDEPLAGAGTWTATDMELPEWRLGPNELRQISCPFWGLCAAGGDVGTILTSASPSGGKAAWSKSITGDPDDFYNGAGPPVYGLDCPAWWFCAAVVGGGTVATTLDPPNPPVPWFSENTPGNLLRAISCSYEGGLCVAVSDWGWTVSALDGTSGDPTWKGPEPFEHEGLQEVSCAPADAFCLVVDDEGYGTVGTIGDDGSTEPAEMPSVVPAGSGNPTPKRHCRKKSKGSRAGKLAVGGAVPLSSAGKRSRNRCSRPA